MVLTPAFTPKGLQTSPLDLELDRLLKCHPAEKANNQLTSNIPHVFQTDPSV